MANEMSQRDSKARQHAGHLFPSASFWSKTGCLRLHPAAAARTCINMYPDSDGEPAAGATNENLGDFGF
jgi:hypothetical protein